MIGRSRSWKDEVTLILTPAITADPSSITQAYYERAAQHRQAGAGEVDAGAGAAGAAAASPWVAMAPEAALGYKQFKVGVVFGSFVFVCVVPLWMRD